jgi:methylamine utilization protein MauE
MSAHVQHLLRRPTSGRLMVLTAWLAGLLVACALLTSAYAHLQNPYRFLEAIYGYRLLPRAVAELLAAVLPFLHITLALCLIAGYWLTAAFRIGTVLFLVYMLAQTSVLARQMRADCGCFGSSATSRPIGLGSVMLAAGILLCCLLGLWYSRQNESSSRSVHGIG